MLKCGMNDIKTKLKTMKTTNLKYKIFVVLFFMSFYFDFFYTIPRNQISKEKIINETITPSFSNKENSEFELRIIKYGDVDAYENYMLHHFGPEMLQYSIIMACKYNYPKAYYDIYSFIVEDLYKKNGISIDSVAWNNSFDFLVKSANLKYARALRELSIIYKNGNEFIKADTTKFLFYKEEYMNIKK